MLRPLLALLVIAPMARPAPAQGFEGTVVFQLSSPAAGANSPAARMSVAIKGPKTATTMTMFGTEVHVLHDGAKPGFTIYMPVPPNVTIPPQVSRGRDVKGMYFDVAPPAPAAGTTPRPAAPATAPTVKKLGTHETVAGLSCDDYEVTAPAEPVVRMCIVESLGKFVFPAFGNGPNAPGWATAFGDRPVFPLKVWTLDGRRAMEVLSIKREPLPASIFQVPDGYVERRSLMGGS